MNTKTYTLPELVSVNIDSWVNAISYLSDCFGWLVEGYDPDKDCPAEFEKEFNAVAEKRGILFTEDGEIYSEDN